MAQHRFLVSVNESEPNWAVLALKTYIWELCQLCFVQKAINVSKLEQCDSSLWKFDGKRENNG